MSDVAATEAETPTNLTSLQEAAVERIRFFQDEFRKLGLYPRLSMEQEFLITDEHGKPALILPRDDTPKTEFTYAKDKHYRGLVSYLRQQGIHFVNSINTEYASLNHALKGYEASFDDMAPYSHKMAFAAPAPLLIATDIHHFRTRTLPEILKSGSCLGSHWVGTHSLLLDPVPFPDDEKYKRETLGLHANISLYDKKGNNLFNHDTFRHKCAEELMMIQRQAGLGFLQNEKGLARIRSNESAPHTIGVRTGDDEKDSGMSLLERTHIAGKYLENRMSGANADPFVITALELAVLYRVVTRHPDLLHLRPLAKPVALPFKENDFQPIEKNIKIWQERFTANAESLKNLLGEKLFSTMADVYGATPDGLLR